MSSLGNFAGGFRAISLQLVNLALHLLISLLERFFGALRLDARPPNRVVPIKLPVFAILACDDLFAPEFVYLSAIVRPDTING